MISARTIRHRAQYTALVDILFATIGVFVIVFALQDLEPTVALQPAPYQHLVTCGPDRTLTYFGGAVSPEATTGEALGTGARAIDRLEPLLGAGGRVLVALSAACLDAVEDGSDATRLRALEDRLSERRSNRTSSLTLFEFAPVGTGPYGIEAIIADFMAEVAR